MPQKRSQRTEEQLEALLTLLEEQGVIGAEWADSIRNVHDHGQGFETAEAARNGDGPPDHSRGGQ